MFIFAAATGPSMAATLDIMPGINNLAIQQVAYEINSSEVIQPTEASGVLVTGDTPVHLKGILAGGTNFTYFNTGLAQVFNVNPQLGSTAGVGVFDNGVYTPSNAGLESYAKAVAGTSMDTDIRNYGYHDFLSPGPTDPAVADLDLQFSKALNLDDHLVVTERWGNSSFMLLALAADGQPYENSNILRLGGSGDRMNGYGVHDWNTGFASLGNVSSQAQALTLFSVSLFFENTSAIAGPIYGLRIFNYDEADVKILGISDNTFADNPDNPNIIPEPSVTMAALAGGMALLLHRKRRQ